MHSLRKVPAVAILLAAVVATPLTAAHADTPPNDPLYEFQWGPQQVDAEAAWPASTGAGAVIAVIDSGVDRSHEDLAGKIVGGRTFVDCGDEGCGDGDWQSGYGNDPNRADFASPHGTHVAGIAAAATDNGTGIAGVAPDAGLLTVKVGDDFEITFDDIARGIDWAVDHGADVINLSLGSLLPTDSVLTITGITLEMHDAIERANAAGVVVVAAAGNESMPLCGDPAVSEGVICVGATDQREAKSWYGHFPAKPDLLGVSAPGGALNPLLCYEDVVSTVPAGEGIDECDYPDNLAYSEFAGTSMASPHVAGVAAVLAARGHCRDVIISSIIESARNPLTGTRGAWDPAYGYGIVDADDALLHAATDDTPCSGVTAVDGSGGERANRGNDRGEGNGPPENRGRGQDRE